MNTDNEFDQLLINKLGEADLHDPLPMTEARIFKAATRQARLRRAKKFLSVPALAASILVATVFMNSIDKTQRTNALSFVSAEQIAEMALGLLVSPAYAAPDLPPGWGRAGSALDDYEMGISADASYSGKYGAYIRSNTNSPAGFGTLMQAIGADQYKGKRIQLTAYMRSNIQEGKLQMWMRVDMPNRTSASFDNMYDRAVLGKTEWQPYSIVLDVPEGAVAIAFGFFLNGKGEVHADGFELGIVDRTVPTTDKHQRPLNPMNLDFEQ